jgi:hypothetical protein
MVTGVGWVVRPSQTRVGARMGMVGAMVNVWVVVNGLGGVVGATYHFFVFLLTRTGLAAGDSETVQQHQRSSTSLMRYLCTFPSLMVAYGIYLRSSSPQVMTGRSR